MPFLKNRYDYLKFYRPNGIRYGFGEGMTIFIAIEQAAKSFVDEFGCAPRQDETIIEVSGDTGGYTATFIEQKVARQ